jgi:single-strand DNA-binding protein
MPNLNAVYLMGNLTRDPDMRHTPKGTAIAELGLAIKLVWTDNEGAAPQKREEVTFGHVWRK